MLELLTWLNWEDWGVRGGDPRDQVGALALRGPLSFLPTAVSTEHPTPCRFWAERQRDCKFNTETSTTRSHNFKIGTIFYHTGEIRATSRYLILTHCQWSCPPPRIWHGRITVDLRLSPSRQDTRSKPWRFFLWFFSAPCSLSRFQTGWHKQFLEVQCSEHWK